ncbi:hypothetical protein Bca4012_063761 [Brassica carinata]
MREEDSGGDGNGKISRQPPTTIVDRFQIFTGEYIQTESHVSPATFDPHVVHAFHVQQFSCPQMGYPQSCRP